MEIAKERLTDFFTINKNKKIAGYSLLAIFIVAILAYNLLLVYGFANPDGINEGFYYYIAADWASEGCGRWLIRYFNLAQSNIVIPVITITEYCIFTWISVVVVAKVLDVKNTISVLVTSAFFIVLPGVITQLTYTFTAAAYGFSCMLSSLYVYFCLKNTKVNYLISSVLLCCSMALYQSHVGYAAALMMMALIIKLIRNKGDYKAILGLFIKSIISALIGAFLYFVLYKIDLIVFGLDTIERVSEFNIADIFNNLPTKFLEMYKVYFSLFSDGLIKRNYIYGALLLSAIYIFLKTVYREIKAKEYVRAVVITAGILLIPPASELIGIIAPFNKVSNMMACQNYLIIPFVLSLYETNQNKTNKYILFVTTVITLILSWTYVLSANATYRSYQISYNHLNNEMNKVLSSVYDLDGYVKNETVIMMGGFPNDDVERENIQVYRYAIDFPSNVAFWEDMTGATTNRYWYFMNMFGVDAGVFSDDDYYSVITSKEFSEMPVWPAKGSVKLIGDFAVAKFEDDVPLP